MKIISRYKYSVSAAAVTLAIALFIALVAALGLLNRGTPGSFEYIRKGEALLDEGRYAEAIKYYEKANTSSPESEAIKNGLIYAYSKYAVNMAESEKYDSGITYLSKAYDITGNVHTRQNLALMYAKKALSEIKSSDWTGAEADLDTALEVAGDSVRCGRNLGIALFNDAAVEHKAGRDRAAIMLLKTAAHAYADSRIYEFLGDIYYNKTELDRGLFYLNKAIKLDPDNKKLAEKLERVTKEEAIALGEETKVLPFFDLKYEKDLPVNADLAAKILEKAYFDVGGDLSYLPRTSTAVFFYSEKNFRDIFKMRDIVRAFYDGNIRIPLPVSMSEEKELASYLYHEYTHAVISAKTNNNCPVWLSEGIAVYEEIKWTRPGQKVSIPENINYESDISIKALDAAFKDPNVDPAKLILSYRLACTAVEYMADNWGMRSLNDVLKAIADGRHAVNAMDDEYLLSEKEFNKRWSNFVKERYAKKGGS